MFICIKCGKCCHDITLSKAEVDMFKYILKDDSKIKKVTESTYIYIGICPFLREDNLCDIYSFRPMVCKLYPVDDKCECVT